MTIVKDEETGEAVFKAPKQRQKHNYTSELELKSLLIRIKNKRSDIGSEDANKKINKYIKWHTKMTAKKYDVPAKRNIIKSKIKAKIILLSEETSVDRDSYERFGTIILLMIKNILKKPSFSGYTYRDDFYSDAIYKILKYLHNFNHKMISERTGTTVNSFAYISQIIHNSIIFIINSKKKENERLKKQIMMEHLDHNYKIKAGNVNYSHWNEENPLQETVKNIKEVHLDDKITSLVQEVKNLHYLVHEDHEPIYTRVKVYYPKDYSISFEEYNELKLELKGKFSILQEEV